MAANTSVAIPTDSATVSLHVALFLLPENGSARRDGVDPRPSNTGVRI